MWHISQWQSLLSFSVAAAATLAGVLPVFFFFFSFMTIYSSQTSKPQVVQRLSSCLRGCLQVVKAPQGNCSFWNIYVCIYIYFSNLFTFNRRIIVLQYCIGFCHTLPWINHSYMYVPTRPPPCPSHSSRLLHSPSFSSLSHTASFHWLLYAWQCICFHATLSIHSPVLPTPPHSWVCCLCLHLHCCSANRFISTIFLDSIHMH